MRKANVLQKISIMEAAVDCFEGSFPRSPYSLGFFSTSERCNTGPVISNKLTAILDYGNLLPSLPSAGTRPGDQVIITCFRLQAVYTGPGPNRSNFVGTGACFYPSRSTSFQCDCQFVPTRYKWLELQKLAFQIRYGQYIFRPGLFPPPPPI